ncbi:MAG: hypothetical protein PHX83_08105 [Acidobacteriia bacterium]|nr:hypothetical protein [Terriglobia bacterium]
MAVMTIKEFSTGKLYVSEEASKSGPLRVEGVDGKITEITLQEAILVSGFSNRPANYKNQVSLLASCASAGIFPKVSAYALSAKNPNTRPVHLLLIAGSYDDYLQYEKLFYRSEVETIFSNLFHSQNWDLINAEASHGNVARKGFGISSLETLESLLRDIRNGNYLIDQVIH